MDGEPDYLAPVTGDHLAAAARYYLDDPAGDAATLLEQSRYAEAAAELLAEGARRRLARVTVTIGLGGLVVRLASHDEGRREAFAAWGELLGCDAGVTSPAEPGLLARGSWEEVPVALASGELAAAREDAAR